MSFRGILRSGIALGALAIGGTALAQDAAPSQQDEDVIVVTGTNIQGARINEALPVTIIGEADIAAIGGVDGEDLIRALPAQGSVQFRTDNNTTNNNARGDVASINLRSIGSSGTLVLLNGRRVVNHPSTQAELSTPVTTTNVNALPVAGISRVEVLNDGASAIYGTDAVAGVFNTILDDDYEGLYVRARHLFATGNGLDEQTLTVKAGDNFNEGRTNVSISAEYSRRDGLFASEVPLAASEDLRPFLVGTSFEGDVSFDNRATQSPWGQWTLNTTSSTRVRQNGTTLTSTAGVFHFQPTSFAGCRADTAGALSVANLCIDDGSLDRNLRFDGAYDRSIISDRDRFNGFAFVNHDLDNGVRLYAEFGYYYAETRSTNEPRNGIAATNISVPANYYYNPFGPITFSDGSINPNRLPGLTNVPAEGLPVFTDGGRYRFVDVGFRDIEVINTQWRALGGARGEFANGWDWDSALLYNRGYAEDTVNNSISRTLFQQALFNETPNVYNIFNGGDPDNPSIGDATANSRDLIDPFLVDVVRESTTELALIDFKVSNGDVFSLPGGAIGIAAGVEARYEAYDENRDDRVDGTITFTDMVTGEVSQTDIYGTSPTPDSSGSRDVLGAFMEASIPLVSPDMNIPLVDTFDVQIAARIEDYSDFGSSGLKPRVAAAWRPFEGLMFRGAYSEGFRAPNLIVINEGVDRSNAREDSYFCEAGVRNGTFATFADCTGFSVGRTERRSVADDIGPEDDTNITFGVVLEPRGFSGPMSFLNALTVTVDRWEIEREGVVGVFGAENHISLDYLLRLQGSSNPNVVRDTPDQDDIDYFTAAGLDPAGDILYILDTYDNNEEIEVAGIDYALYYDLEDTRYGDFNLKINASYLDTYFIALSPGAQQIRDAVDSGLIADEITVSQEGDIIMQDGQPEWRVGASLSWSHPNGLGAGIRADYTSEFIDTGAGLNPDGDPFIVESWTQTNAYVEYEFDRQGPLDNLRIRVGANNIFDEDPPLADETNGYDAAYHSIRGRQVYFDIRKVF
ncbi:MAG: TonB-dependent receptor [Maricaulis sp.]|uniref:TonB-dependent receptor n=1 Tax=Maricaulis virginensis TaxID=144022 RepID=A0A9W6ILF8_9PROT|nr:TonB-dependent receptor [Maricaulis virginensis]MAC38704.1 TonB-dependent receptor [Oceanicaulis sp.]MAZ92575.1 TonB-dependent receptor [Maricaulis sp.]GLK52443.1 TonB-dependent receptor [Maricaulis virginensis]